MATGGLFPSATHGTFKAAKDSKIVRTVNGKESITAVQTNQTSAGTNATLFFTERTEPKLAEEQKVYKFTLKNIFVDGTQQDVKVTYDTKGGEVTGTAAYKFMVGDTEYGFATESTVMDGEKEIFFVKKEYLDDDSYGYTETNIADFPIKVAVDNTTQNVTVTLGDVVLGNTTAESYETITLERETGDTTTAYFFALDKDATKASTWKNVTYTVGENATTVTCTTTGPFSRGWSALPGEIIYDGGLRDGITFTLAGTAGFASGLSATKTDDKYVGNFITFSGKNLVLAKGLFADNVDNVSIQVTGADNVYFGADATPGYTPGYWEAATGTETPQGFKYQNTANTVGFKVDDDKTITKVPAVGATTQFTISGLGNATFDETTGKIAGVTVGDESTTTGEGEDKKTTTAYTVTLDSTALVAATPEANQPDATIKVTVAADVQNTTAALDLAKDATTAALPTTLAKDTSSPAKIAVVTGTGDEYTHNYRSDAFKAYYELGSSEADDETAKIKDQITIHAPVESKTFNISGLNKNATAEQIGYTYTAPTAAVGETPAGAASYAFTVKTGALNKADVVIKLGSNTDNITAKLDLTGMSEAEKKEISGKTAIEHKIEATTDSLTYTFAGFQAGYINAAEIPKEDATTPTGDGGQQTGGDGQQTGGDGQQTGGDAGNGDDSESSATEPTFATDLGDHDAGAQIIYAKQRHGETFTISGLKLTEAQVKSVKTTTGEGEDATTTYKLPSGITLGADNKITVAKSMLNTSNNSIILTRTIADVGYESKKVEEKDTPAFTKYTLAIGGTFGTAVVNQVAPTITEPDSSVGTGDAYIAAYKEAFDSAMKTALEADGADYFRQAAKLDPATTESTGTSSTTTDETSKTYSYTSSYNAAFYTKLPEYSETVANFAGEKFKDIQGKSMAAKNQDVFFYNGEGSYLTKYAFDISGLNTDTSKVNINEVGEGRNKKTDDDTSTEVKAITIDYTATASATDTTIVPTVTINKAEALATKPKDGEIVAISGKDAKFFTLKFGEALTTTAATEVMSEKIDKVEVTENLDENEKGTGTYTVTLKGNTAGYEKQTDGSYKYLAQSGCEQFTITGLKSGIASTLQEDLANLTATNDGTVTDEFGETTTVPQIKFALKFDYLDTEKLFDEDGKVDVDADAVKLTYNGQVTNRKSTTTEGVTKYTDTVTIPGTKPSGESDDDTKKYNPDDKTILALDVSDLANHHVAGSEAGDGGWQQAKDENGKVVDKSFVFVTKQTADKFAAGEYKAADHSISLVYTAKVGGDKLITLTGLTATDASKLPTPVQCNASGYEYIGIEGTANIDNKPVAVTRYYASEDVTYDEATKTYTPKETATVGYTINKETGKQVKGDGFGTDDLTNFLVKLTSGVDFSKTDMETKGITSVTETPVAGAPYEGAKMHVSFDGENTVSEATPKVEYSTLTLVKDTTAAADATTATYVFQPPHTPHSYVAKEEKEGDVVKSTTYTYTPAANDYSCTIEGLPKGIKGTGADSGNETTNYVTYTTSTEASPAVIDKNTFTVYFKEAAFGVTKDGSGNVTAPKEDTTIKVTKVDLDGNNDSVPDTDEGTGENLKFKIAMTKTSASDAEPLTKKTVATGAKLAVPQNGETGAPAAGAKTATYTYTSATYAPWYELDQVTEGSEELNATATYHVQSGGKELFKISGLAYNSTPAENPTILTTSTTGADGKVTTTQGSVDVDYNETAANVMVYADALGTEKVTLTDLAPSGAANDDKVTCTLNIFDQSEYDKGYNAQLTSGDKKTYEETFKDRIVSTDAKPVKGTFVQTPTAQGGTGDKTSYNFTAGYTTGKYTKNANGEIEYTAREGNPDVLTIKGLAEDLPTGEDAKVASTDGENGAKIFTVTSKDGSKTFLTINYTPEKTTGSNTTPANYSVQLGKDALAASPSSTTNIELSVAKGAKSEDTAEKPVAVFTLDGLTQSTADAAATLEKVETKDAAGNVTGFTHTYTTSGATAGYAFGTSGTPATEDKTKITYVASAQETYSISGLKEDAKADFDKATTADKEKLIEVTTGTDTPATTNFKLNSSILGKSDIVIKKGDATTGTTANITASFTGTYPNGETPIAAAIKVVDNNTAVELTMGGYQAGFIAKDNISGGSESYAKGVHTNTEAQYIYADQRNGETFTISGLSTEVAALTATAFPAKSGDKYTFKESTDPSARTLFEIDTSAKKVTVSELAFGTTGDITLKRTNADAEFEKTTTAGATAPTKAFNTYTLAIDGAGTTKVLSGVSFNASTVSANSAAEYITAYETAYDDAKKTALATEANKGIKTDADLKVDDTATTNTDNAKTYTYTSSYNKAYYTQVPAYSAAVKGFDDYFTDTDVTTQLVKDGYMVADANTDKFKLTPKGDIKSFKISGLAASSIDGSSVQEITDATTKIDTSKAITVDYENKKVIVNNTSALPTETNRKGTTVAVSDIKLNDATTGAPTFTLEFGEALTKGTGEVMSEPIDFVVNEVKNTTNGTSTYTVTLEGNTAGYEKNAAGAYVHKDQSGGQQFTIAGLAQGLTLTKDMFDLKTTTETSAGGAATEKTVITFKMANGQIANATTTLTYLGNVSKVGTTATQKDANTSFALDTSAVTTFTKDEKTGVLSDASTAKAATWSKDGNNFIFKTETSAATWTPDAYGSNKVELTYKAPEGAETLITLTGLTATDTSKLPTTPVYCDESGNRYYPHEELVMGSDNKPVKTNVYYTATQGTVNDDGTITPKSGEKGKKVDEINNFLVELPASTFTATKGSTVTYTEGSATTGTYSGKKMHIGFNGYETVDSSTGSAPARTASLTETTTQGTYKYVAAGTDAYFESKENSSNKTTTYTFTPATKDYGFTISGLPKGLKDKGEDATALTGTGIDTYFTTNFATATDGQYVVTLKKDALGTGTVKLESTDVDGDNDDQPDTVGTTTKTPVTIKLALDSSQNSGINQTATVKTPEALPPTTTPAADAKIATYTYTSPTYNAYYTLDDAKTTVTYTAEKAGAKLFTIEGLSTSAKLPERDASGNINALHGIQVNDKTGEVLLSAAAFNGSNITLKPESGQTATLALLDQDYYDTNIKDNTGLSNTEKKAYYDAILLSKEDSDPATFAAGANGAYTFTAGYTKEYFQLDGTTTAKYHAQKGNPDVLTITGLAADLAKDAEVTKEGDVYTVAIPASEDGNTPAKTLFEVTYKAETAASGTTAAVPASYSVKLFDDAIATEKQGNIVVEINKNTPTGSDANATALFDISGLTNKNVPTEQAATLSPYDEKDTTNTRRYVSKGNTAGYTFDAKTNPTQLTWNNSTQETFTISGLNKDAKDENINYTHTPANATAGTAEAHTFEIAVAALGENDVVIKKDNATTGIIATIEGTYTSATKEIPQSVKVAEKVLTYTASGFEAGYMTPTEVAAANLSAEHTDAAIAYVKQRNGERFNITGLSEDALKVLGKDYKIPAVSNNVITFKDDAETSPKTYFTLNPSTNAVTLFAAALGKENIVFTSDKNSAGTGDQYNVSLGSDVIKLNAPTVTVPSTAGFDQNYVDAYKKAFDDEKDKLAAANTNIKAALTFDKKEADATATTPATSATYDYKSSFNKEYFTQLPKYNEDVALYAGNFVSGLVNTYMAAKDATAYQYTAATESKTFSISGLATNVQTSAVSETSDAANIYVNLTDSKVTINSKDVLSEKDTVALSNNDANFTLAFGETLTKGTGEVMSEDIAFDVKEDQTTAGTYTVTLAGTTAGYKYNETTKAYDHVEQTGGQQFTITGLAPKLTQEQITADLFNEKKDETTGKGTGAFTFTISDGLIKETYDNAAEIKIEYTGTVTNTTGHEGTEKTEQIAGTTVEFNNKITPDKKADAAWAKEGDNFVFKTAKTAATWTDSTETVGTSDTLKYTASTGGNDLVTLGGLTASDEKALPDAAYAEANGTLLKSHTTYGMTADRTRTEIVSWYKAEDLDEKGAPKSDTTTPIVKVTKNQETGKVINTEGLDKVEAYRFDLGANTFNKDTMVGQAVTYKPGTATDATYQNKQIFIAFAGSLPTDTAPERKASLTAVDTTIDESGKTYDYVAAGTDDYFKTSTSQTDTTVTEYNFVRRTNDYGFRIAGLPAGKTTDDISSLFTFEHAKDADGQDTKEFVVTLTEAAFGTEERTVSSEAVIALTTVDLDGNKDGTNDDGVDIKLALPKNSTTINTNDKAIATNPKFTKAADTEADAETATYTYKSTQYKGYYALEAQNAQSVNYTAARGGEDLFTLSGVKNMEAGKLLTEYAADGTSINTLGAVLVDEDKKQVMLTKEAFNDENITLDAKESGYQLALLDKAYYDANIKDSEMSAANRAKYEAQILNKEGDQAVPGSIVWDETAKTYTFTASYTPAHYEIQENTAAATPQVGHADKIKLEGLDKDAIVASNELTATKNEDGNYVYTIKNSSSQDVLTITYKVAKEDDAETTVDESVKEGYTVALTDAALPVTPGNISLTINKADDREATDAPEAKFDIAAVNNTPKPTYGSFAVTKPAEGEIDPHNYTFMEAGTTDGYKLGTDATKVTYEQKDGCKEFTITGLAENLGVLGAEGEGNDIYTKLAEKGVTVNATEGTVVLGAEALAKKNIAFVSDELNYELKIVDTVTQSKDAATDAGKFTAVDKGVATYTTTKINEYYEADGQKKFLFHGEEGGKTFEIKGLADVTTDELNVKENAPIEVVEGDAVEGVIPVTVTLNDTAIFAKPKDNNSVVKLDGAPEGYTFTLKLGKDVDDVLETAPKKEPAWALDKDTAAYQTGGFSAYFKPTYTDEEKTAITQLEFNPEIANKTEFAFSGLSSAVTAEELDRAVKIDTIAGGASGVTISFVTISDTIGGASGATITNNTKGYEFVLNAADSLTGTDGVDTLTAATEGAYVFGGKGNDQMSVAGGYVDGGEGNDYIKVGENGGTVAFSTGKDTVEYGEGLVIKHDKAYSYEFAENKKTDESGKIVSGDVLLKDSDGNTLLLKDAAGKAVSFEDVDGKVSPMIFDTDISEVFTFNQDLTGVTVKPDYDGTTVGPNEFAGKNASESIVTIDAAAAVQGLAITGTAKDNVIIGTAYGDTIDAGESTKESSNIIKGGTGDDVFIYRDGKLTITDFKSVDDDTDALQLMIGGTSSTQHEVKEVAISGDNLTFTLDEGSIELKDVFKSAATVDVAISDAQGDELSAYNYDKSGVVADGEESVTLLSNFSKSEYAGANIDASAVTKALKLTLTDSGTVKGGKDADTFIIDEGASEVVIENYTADDKINFKVLNKDDVSGVKGKVTGDDVVLNYTTGEGETAKTVSVTVTGGAGKAINLVDNSGKALASNVYSEIGTFNDKQTAITLAATAGNFDANGYNGLASIDASAVTSAITVTANASVNSYIVGSDSAALVLNGGNLDDTLISGDAGATLNGNAGNNSIVAGDGADVIVLSGGTDIVEGFNAKFDKLVTGGTSVAAKLRNAELKANKSVYSLALEFDNDSKVTLAGVESVAAVNIDNTAYTFGEGFVQIGTEVTLAASYDTTKAYKAADSITAVDATATKGVSVIGGLSTTEIAGGTGNDFLGGFAKKLELTGGAGNDTFAYISGAVSIADFAPSADAISLEAFNVTELSAVTVTDEKVTLDFGQGNTLTFKDAENAEVNVFDAENTKGKKFNFATGEITSGKEQILLAGGTSVAIGDDYKYTLVTAASDMTLDASKAEKTKFALTLMNGGSAVGGEKDDTLRANNGGSLTGGLGADTFVFGGGNATITDYKADQKDKIVASDLTLSTVVSYSADKKDVILTYTDEGQVTNTLYIKDGADKALTLDGRVSTFSGQGTLNSAKTAITLAPDTSVFKVNDTDYTKLSSIDASQVTVPGATITAGDVNTTITSGAVGLKLTGGTKNDVIISGDGADTIFVGAGGNDAIQNFEATKDALATVEGAKIDDAAIDTNKHNLTLTLTTPVNDKGKTSTSKVVVDNITPAADGSAKVTVNGAEWTFSDKSIKSGTSVQLTSKYTDKAYHETDTNITEINASATKGLTLSGGNPYNVTLTGSEKGADTFVYNGGNDVITNYGKGKDVISLSSDAYDMSDLSGVKVTENKADAKDKSGTIALTFTKGQTAETLSLKVDDTTKPVTIANNDTPKGTAYTFKDNALAVGKAITLLSGDANFDVAEATAKGASLAGYTSIALNYAATVTAAPNGSNVTLLKGGEITGDKGKDTLKAAGDGTAVLTGKGGADTFIYDGGTVTVTDYNAGQKDVVSIAADWNVSGINVGAEATTLDLLSDNGNGTLILEKVKDGDEVLFASGGGKATKSYFSTGKILDGKDDSKVKSAIAVGPADFSTLYDKKNKKDVDAVPAGGDKNLEDKYKALVTITSGGAGADVTGNSKNNIITLANGGTAKGGIGNDTYIVGGNTTITDFGINAKTIMNTAGNGLVKLPTKVNTVANAKKDSIPAYSPEVGGYAEGKDKVQVKGKIVGVTFSDDIAVPADKKDKNVSDANSFSVTLTVDTDTTTETEGDTFTVVLQNIQRDAKAVKNANPVNKNNDYKDISSLQIYELDGTKYKQVKADALIELANGDAPDFGSADLDDIMEVTPAVTTGDSGKTKDADSFIVTGSGDDSSDLTSKKN